MNLYTFIWKYSFICQALFSIYWSGCIQFFNKNMEHLKFSPKNEYLKAKQLWQCACFNENTGSLLTCYL